MVTAMWTSAIIKEPDNYWGRELFFFCLSESKIHSKGRKEKKKKDSQTVGYWCVVFTSIRRSERMFLGTTVIFLKKLQMCLQMKNTLFHGSPVPRKWPSRCSLTNGRDPPGALWQSILTNRQNSSHLFLQKSLSFIFTLSMVISWFSLLGKAFRLLWQPCISSPKGTSPLPKPYFSLESHATSSPVSLLGVL